MTLLKKKNYDRLTTFTPQVVFKMKKKSVPKCSTLTHQKSRNTFLNKSTDFDHKLLIGAILHLTFLISQFTIWCDQLSTYSINLRDTLGFISYIINIYCSITFLFWINSVNNYKVAHWNRHSIQIEGAM